MRAIHIRRVPDDVLAALRERARRHGRSMQEEAIAILKAAAAEPLPAEPVRPIRLKKVRVGRRSSFRREDIYGDEGR